MKVKLNGQKIIASVVVAAMSIAFIPKITGSGNVLAATTKSADNTRLCTTDIASPVAPANADSAWKGSYVYFGTYGGNPIKFRVLAPSTDVYGGSTLFLDSDQTLFNDYFDNTPDSEGHYLNFWDYSDIRGVLNGTFLTGFTSLEQGVIATSKGNGGLSYAAPSFGATVYGAPVSVNDKVFLLDATEVMNPAYGYSADCGWTTTSDWTWANLNDWGVHEVANRKKDGSSAYWWLRSANADAWDDAGLVYVDGLLYDYYVAGLNHGVAPALNVDRNSIIFSTCVDGTYGEVGASYKLTIFDDSLSITAGEAYVSGTSVSIGNTVSGGPSQISVLILSDKYTDGNTNGATIKYYGALSEEQSFDFSATGLDLSGWGKDYYVYILAEKINGDFETDYATKPVEVAAPASDSSSSSSGSSTTTDPATSSTDGGATMDPTAPTYTVIQGADSTVDGKSDVVIEIKRSEDDEHCLSYFDWVAVDGTKLTNEQAPTSSGSTIITIKSDYLKTLSEGKHTIVVNFVDNSVSTTITIQAAAQKSGTAVPATGELQSPVMYLGIALIVAACGITSAVVMKKRKEET